LNNIMKYLLSHWDAFSRGLKKHSNVYLFFDYDGTLTPIVSAPELAKLSPGIKKVLTKLRDTPGFNVAVISGRSLKNIKKTVGLKKIAYAGNHGLEMERGSREILKTGCNSVKPLLKKIYVSLYQKLQDVDGVRIEDKGCTLSLHYRLAAPENRSLIKKIFSAVVRPYCFEGKIRVSAGKMVFEVRPGVDWNKGNAVLSFLSRAKKNAFPIYVGDDVTDEDAFNAISGKGVSIFVGGPNRRVKADYYLKDTADVVKFMEQLYTLSPSGRG
jgi:trehalose-phosphatase